MTPDADPLTASCPGPLPADELTLSRELLQRAQGGDAAALNRLLERYYERVRRIVSIRLGSAARRTVESSDIVQETFRAALRGFNDLRATTDASILNWLAEVAENRIRDEIARSGRAKRSAEREEELDRAPAARELAASATTPPEAAARRELRELVDRELALLPTEYREVVLLRDYCGEDWSVVAAKLGRENVNAAQALHQRAWIRLRKKLRGKFGERS